MQSAHVASSCHTRGLNASNLSGDNVTPVAIIGLACRLPGDASTPARFWDLLCKARSAYSEIPPDRFNVNAFHSNNKDKINTTNTRGGHFLRQDVAAFDASFFGISQSEAMAMDPQQRIMLEVAYEAFENAGIQLESVAGTDTGCFMGNFTSDYREMLFRDPDSAPLYAMTGSGGELISNRVSWFFDLKGPSLTLNTACSSSLVALHQGCQSIRIGESSTALIGASNLLLNPDMFMFLSNQNFLAQDGRCRSFDAAGGGYGRGEGFAAVVVKNFNDAIRDGNPIRAVIRATGVNQDGKTTGLTVPSAEAQANMIRSTYNLAGLDFKDTNYFEAHGTGTKVGDPLELEGIANIFSCVRTPGNPLVVGSVKSNIGHLESVAGLAGLIKGIYILEQGMIPPNINFREPNRSIPFSEWKITVPTKLIPWSTKGRRRMSVQGFGYGGTNAHAVLDDAYHFLCERQLSGVHYTQVTNLENQCYSSIHPERHFNMLTNGAKGALTANKDNSKHMKLFLLSAHDKYGLKRQGKNLAEYLHRRKGDIQTEHIHLRDLAFTLAEKRSRLAWRLCFSASSHAELISKLQHESNDFRAVRPSKVPLVGFIFTGQGAQWARMGVELLQYRIFRESIEDADHYLCSSLGCNWSAMEELLRDKSSSNIDLPAYSQPLCTLLQVALVDLLQSWNIKPSALVGHSSGEIAAAYCLGALAREDAWKIAYFRGLLSSQMRSILPPLRGSMLAVGISETEAEDWISRNFDGEVVVACINSPSSVTLSGNTSSINDMDKMLKEAGVFVRRLKVDTAYHSPHMEMISVSYLESIRDVQTRAAHESRKMYSTVTGCLINSDELGSINWVRNLVSPVLFYDAVRELLDATRGCQQDVEGTVDMLIEIGPYGSLKSPINQIMKQHDIKGVNCYSILAQGRNAVDSALATAGALSAQGVPVDIPRVNNDADDIVGALGRTLVDLPSYCWNHSRTYWAESRISKQFRFRGKPRRSLIGAPCATYGEQERLWRGFLRLSEEPWVRDHRIQTSIIYPAAGYLAMAMEGAYQLAAESQMIQKFCLRDVQIVAPAVVTEDSDVEFILQLRPHYSGTRNDTSFWQEFTVSTCNNGQDLRKNCYGLLLVQYQPTQETGMSLEMRLEEKKAKDLYEKSARLCQTREEPNDFYKTLASLGLNYGPSFRNLSRIRSRNGESCCNIVVSEAGIERSIQGNGRPHIIHPSTLDAIFHTIFAAFKTQNGQFKDTMVPKSIGEIMISASIPFEHGTQFKGFSSASKYGFRDLMGNITMLDKDLNKPVVVVKKFNCTAISRVDETEEARQESNAGRLYSKQIWKPTLELCSTFEKKFLINAVSPIHSSMESSELVVKSRILVIYYLHKVVKRLRVEKIPTPHLQDLYGWMQAQLISAGEVETASLLNGSSSFDYEKEFSTLGVPGEKVELLESEVESSSIEGQALCQVGQRLQQILCGETDAEELLRQSGILQRLFVELRGMDRCLQKIGKLIDMMAHTNPNLSVLEIGTSVQSATPSIISSVSRTEDNDHQRFEYIFSTSHKQTLGIAEEHLKPWKDHIKFKNFDLGNIPAHQDLQHNRYDVIVVSDLLLAARDLNTFLTQLRELLKPGGKLCIVHTVETCIELTLVLHCLPSWGCTGNQSLHFGLMDMEALKPLLEKNEFIIDFTVADFEDARLRELSVTVSTASVSTTKVAHKCEMTVLEPSIPSEKTRAVTSHLVADLEGQGIKTKKLTWGQEISVSDASNCISLLELDTPFILGLKSEDYTILQKLMFQSANLLWVTGLDEPAAALSVGMLRSIRNEVPGKKFRSLYLQSTPSQPPAQSCNSIIRLATNPTLDDEFREEDGVIKSCRFIQDHKMIESVSGLLAERKETVDLIALEKAQGPQKLTIKTQGMLDTMRFEADDVGYSDLGEDEIEIEVRATGLNFRDVMVVMGQIPDDLLGFEASGLVSRCGKNVSHFQTGEKVCALGHGAHRTLFRTKAAFCKSIPDGMSFEDAATLPLVHCTAYHALINVAHVRKGQTILIHAAAGGVGQSAIQLAKYLGLEIFATVGSGDKKNLVQEAYKIELDHIFDSRDLSFAKGVMRMTEGKGVDCILNSLSGEALRQSWECIAPFGSFVEIGMKDILSNTGLDMLPFLQGASFTSFNLKHIMAEKPSLMSQILDGTFDLLRYGIIRPVSPINSYPISNVENAFRLLQTGKHRGKVALAWRAKDVVPVLRHGDPPLKLNQRATYLLIGGLGGLGRSLARLLVGSGARHLCFISRSGPTSDSAQKLVEELQKRNVQIITYSCDIACSSSLESAILKCTSNMPPIKGVFQCAMVLQDSLFERMSYEQWTTSLRPKVYGTWNLHTLLPHDLDFFISLSSFAGIFGNRSQSNYAAACAYQDAFAHYRRSRGFKAVTVDLGVVRDVGVIAEKGATDYLKEWELPFGMDVNELQTLIKHIITSEMAQDNHSTRVPAQIIHGMATTSTVQAAGVRTPFYFSDPRFSALVGNGSSGLSVQNAGNINHAPSLRVLLGQCSTLASATQTVLDALVAQVAKSLQTSVAEIDEGRPLHNYGIDSLVAVEIANWVWRETKVNVSVFDILTAVSIKNFSEKVGESSAFFAQKAKEGQEEDRPSSSILCL